MFDDGEFLDVARHLHEVSSREGFHRSAISRAYYAALLAARAQCRDRGWIPQAGRGSDHRTVADTLARIDERLASRLRILRQLRNTSDYSTESIEADQLSNTVLYAIDLAEFIRNERRSLT